MFISDENIAFQQHQFFKRKLFKFAMLLLIISSLNYGLFILFKLDIIGKIFSKYQKCFYLLVFVAAIYIMWDRDTYFPFLGRSILPCNILKDSIPSNTNKLITIDIKKPNAKVMFWAAEQSSNSQEGLVNDYVTAYGDFTNSGVATSDKYGIVKIAVRSPQSYKVPFKGILEPHVHFRVCDGPGTLGRVKTIFLKDGKIIG